MRPSARWGDAAAVLLLLAVAAAGWAAVFEGLRWALAAAAGLVLGAATAVAGARWRWPALVVAAATTLVYLVLAGPFAAPTTTLRGAVPTAGTLVALLSGAVGSWKDVLTLPPPVGAGGSALVVPLLSAQLAAVAAVSAVLRARAWWTALLPPVALLVLTALLGTAEPTAPVVRAVLLVAGALGWMGWRRARSGLDTAPVPAMGGQPARLPRVRRAGAAVAVLAVGAVAAGALAPAAGAGLDRWVPRDTVVPPFDPREYPSPLSGYRHYVKDVKDQPLFTVRGLPAGARVRLATLDAFDGTVWDAAGSADDAGSGRFTPLTTSPQVTAVPEGARPVAVEVTVEGYRGVWVPTVGGTGSVDVAGPRATTLRSSLYDNAAAQAVVAAAGLGRGDTYRLHGWLPPTPSSERVADAEAARTALPAPQKVPDAVAGRAAEMVRGAQTAGARAQALAAGLVDAGYYSDGLQGQATSRSGHGADRLASMLAADQMVGDGEQYASLMALMARQLGLPARVVMGFVPAAEAARGADGTLTITGADVSAWVEVSLDDLGWVALDPTPPKDKAPAPSSPKPRATPQAQVQQPPPPPQRPLDPAVSSARDDRDRHRQAGGSPRPWGRIVAAGSPLLLLVVVGGGLAGAKAARRRRRRRRGDAGQRFVGGWAELLDGARDLGAPPPPRHATRREAAAVLPAQHRVEAAVLAARADAGAFAPVRPGEAEAEAYWADVETALQRLRASTSWRRRAWAWVSPRSVVRRRR